MIDSRKVTLKDIELTEDGECVLEDWMEGEKSFVQIFSIGAIKNLIIDLVNTGVAITRWLVLLF